MRRGEVRRVDFEPAAGSEIKKTRPAVIVSRDTANRTMTRVVWNNLLSNAVKFTPPGGAITLTLRTAETGERRFAEVTVRDTGCGMDEATRRRIFDKFYQGDTSHAAEGNGLGLALAKRALEAAGGEIAVESEPGRGTVFTAHLAR